jgi:streptogramin lyase
VAAGRRRGIDLAAHPQDGTVGRIEPASDRTVATIPVGGSAYGMAADQRGVWIALPGEGLLRRIDPHSDALVLKLDLGKSSP